MSPTDTNPVPLLYESHMHTPLCKHAEGLPGDYAAVAAEKGLRGIIVTCHSPMPGGYSANVRMAPEELPAYLEMIDAAAETWADTLEVLPGLESDYVPGMEKWLENLHRQADFHHVLGSVHPFVPEFRKRFFTGDRFAYQQLYFTHLAEAAETGLFDTLAHPDLIKNEFPDEWDLDALMPHIAECLDRIAATGCAMELNTSGLGKRLPEMNPAPRILSEMLIRGIPVVLGADAHRPARVADQFPEALRLLQSLGYRNVSIFRERIRREIPVAAALGSLQASLPGNAGRIASPAAN